MRKGITVLVKDIKKHPKVAGIILFGSYAKKKLKPLSDIDIAVIVKNPDKTVEADIASFSSNVFDVVNFHKLPLYIQFEVLKHGKTLFIRDEKFFSEIRREVLRDYLEMSYLYERMSKKILA
ncbi:MAG: nucleotidyltransferase domain-containing protein [Candidatus Thermoplasmatota archaeon]|nr:nucleotidyltransferase domain-containing protein [Candidatus Thermoplasmatota archaeon]MDI6887643.1 nucleotidyltransferase domain-containing protein [Candidatus Thermoplasmatota archaeon]